MPKLENWSVVQQLNPYRAPELATGCHLHGVLYDHPLLHDDGKNARTSRITSLNVSAKKATTRSGSEYTLGEPKADWLEWMKENGHKLEDFNL